MSAKESLASRREKLEEDLKTTQRHIYDGEEAYIAETSHYGNVVKGWDAFLAATDIKAIHSSRKPKVNDKDRLFTLSSPSYVTEDENGADGDDDPDYMDNADMKQRKKSLAGPGTRKYREDDMYD